jgi:hypothetical protein
LYNGYCEYASYINKFDFEDTTTFGNEEIMNTKANLILNLFESFEGKVNEKLLEGSLEVLSKFYDKASKIMNGEQSSIVNDLKNLKNEILEAISKQGDNGKYCIRMKSPKIPEVSFKLIRLPKEDDLDSMEKEKKVFPKTKFIDLLLDLIDKQKKVTPDNTKIQLDIALAGGSGTIQHFTIAVIVLEKAKAFADVDLKVYLIPLGYENYLASSIEQFDKWWAKMVYYPTLSQLPVLPHLYDENDSFTSKKLNFIREYEKEKDNIEFLVDGKLIFLKKRRRIYNKFKKKSKISK